MLLYHLVPEEMSGTMLYPLNQLKSLHPAIHDYAVNKYIGREAVMQQVIPLLNCLWNDVVFLSPVHPEKIHVARRREGLAADTSKKRDWFILQSEKLIQRQLVLFRHRPQWFIEQEPEKSEYVPFTKLQVSEMNSLSELPDCAIWSIRKFREKSLLQGFIPHLLYKGVIDVTHAEIVRC